MYTIGAIETCCVFTNQTRPPICMSTVSRERFKIVDWSRWRDLNPRPLPYQGSALPLSYIGNVCFLSVDFSDGAEDGAQTRDPQLGRLMLYRLSYFRMCGLAFSVFVGEDGFEPPKVKTSRFTVCPIWPLWYSPFLSLLSDSNQRPRDYKSRALAN